MEYVLNGLEPKAVFKYFEDLTRIPRESNNEKQVSDYLVKFAKDNGLEVIQEPCLNVIIKKPASPGYENAPTVILQGHMDMVCVKTEGSHHDFTKDPIGIYVEGDLIKTKETTLGADNGIAVAMAMAILSDKEAQHPALEALFTIAEETGMDGASLLDGSHLKGTILINIDSEEEGEFLSSCAGGVNNYVYVPIERTKSTGTKSCEVTIRGLLGGHSGMEINKNRANAIKLLGRLIEYLREEVAIEVATVSGGEKMNAIAKFATFQVVITEDMSSKVKEIIAFAEKTFQKEYETADPGLVIEMKPVDVPAEVFTSATLDKFVSLARLIPYGVDTMSNDIKGLVVSSNNIGVLETFDTEIKFTSAVRSSVKSLKDELNRRIAVAAKLTGSRMELKYDYPEWQYKVNSPIRDLMLATYKEMTGKDGKINAIHAGLECGLLSEKVGDIDMISLGPNMHDVHTPGERLEIASTANVFAFLTEVLKRLK